MRVKILFHKDLCASAYVDRALECVLTTVEADTAKHLIGGFYFDTNRDIGEILVEFEEDGFDRSSDFRLIEFSFI